MAKYLTLLNSKLRIDWGDATLILSESEEDPCCCCPDPPTNLCVNIVYQDYTLAISGVHYALYKNGGITVIRSNDAEPEPPTHRYADGFPACMQDNYKLKGYVRAGGSIDDFGQVETESFDNYSPCFASDGTRLSGEKITYITQDSAQFDLSFVAFADDPDWLYIPISFSANSSNCGPPTGISVTVCILFEPKEDAGPTGP